MRLQLDVQFCLKDRPEGYLGVTQESWTFGSKTRPATMAELVTLFLAILFKWHARFLSREDFNKEKDKIQVWLSQIAFTEPGVATRPMREPAAATTYLVYICENCGRPRREPINGEANSDLPWTKIEYCQHCCARHVFLRDGFYPINPPGTTDQASPIFVYLFRAENGLHKIGISTDPVKRLLSMATGPVAIELVWCRWFQNAKSTERALHIRFSDKRVRGEWFELTHEDVAYIEGLAND